MTHAQPASYDTASSAYVDLNLVANHVIVRGSLCAYFRSDYKLGRDWTNPITGAVLTKKALQTSCRSLIKNDYWFYVLDLFLIKGFTTGIISQRMQCHGHTVRRYIFRGINLLVCFAENPELNPFLIKVGDEYVLPSDAWYDRQF